MYKQLLKSTITPNTLYHYKLTTLLGSALAERNKVVNL